MLLATSTTRWYLSPSASRNMAATTTTTRSNMAANTTTTTLTTAAAAKPVPATKKHISELPVTWSNWYQHIDWFKTTLLVFIPLVACYFAYYTPLQRPTFIFSVLLHLWAGIGITAGYHRLWSHRSYTATRPLQIFLGLGGASALEGSIRFWSWGHRAHHRFTDTEKDPYTVHKGRELLSGEEIVPLPQHPLMTGLWR